MYRKIRKHHIHFVGIGGIGMSAIASVLLELGYKVSGSDIRHSSTIQRLVKLGAHISIGHKPENVHGADVVVTSSAVSKQNPEVLEAMRVQIPIIPRAQMLAELMRLKRFGVAVSGTHGKTSTTSMIGAVLEAANIDPTLIIGGQVKSLGTNARWGRGEFLVAEADESDGSFLYLTPSIAVVTNIEEEHLDYYKDLEHIKQTFTNFLKKVPFYGAAIICGDDPNLLECAKFIKKRTITYGVSEGNYIQAKNIQYKGYGSSFEVWKDNEFLGDITLKVPGLHNVRNSLAAIGVGLELELPFEVIRSGLERYRGVGRRFEILLDTEELTLVDDYAHHPTEIQATLKAARACFPGRRLVVLFEPHRYSRTLALMDAFQTCFDEADRLYLTEIYPASEKPIVGITGRRLASTIQQKWGGEVQFVQDPFLLPEKVMEDIKPGDVILTLGAGNMGKIGKTIAELVNEQKAIKATI
ncbi:UDP-N-acetylmuramate--alanine ligase [Dissulfuribacter thermophilus]|uniref:UDP-N-acetylmuramate--L-alanine ligase n=1 Tax=Dissulfuribacter thermophilus TaxID=1156395 RepID=A0A1B9F4H0_9BACT|nr:UDP-N-acetylmuramate--L-alanine ligase [Dissulfuribacter thermophilus]OCC14753.1 UDP-N-acetylmuramate--alanine ligase [Dissulfuribacter thermophilus]